MKKHVHDCFGQRFSRIYSKFDYIVGDWSNEQLRLRGFYKEGAMLQRWIN